MLQGGSVQHPLIWSGTVESRLYQENIARSAYGRNTLVILPTALGKTVISALLAAEVLYRHRRSRVLIMAPTRPLVMQHRKSFMAIMKLRESDIAFLTGKVPPEHRAAIWGSDARVIFSTPEVVRNDLLEGRLNLKGFGLVVFDEAHRAVKEYAYTEIARAYVSQADFPMILGMTASPGSTLERVMDVCRNLYIEKVEFRDEDDPDVKPYINKIDIEWEKVQLPESYRQVRSSIWSMLQKRARRLYEMKLLKVPPDMVTRRDLIEAGEELRYTLEAESVEEERSRIFDAIMTQSIALSLFHMLELIETQGAHTLREFMNRADEEKSRSHAMLAADPEYQHLRSIVDLISQEHPKLDRLKKLVSDQLAVNPSSRMLVFTQYRDTASHIVEELKGVPGVKAERFVGQASKGRDRGMSQDQQASMIRALESGEINVMVSTSIAEEGLDIPAVDHVFFYEPIPSEIRYIQRRGRTGRKAPGKVTILAAEQTLDTAYLYSSVKRAKRMKWIASTLNLKLQPVIRATGMPSEDPMSAEEIAEIENETGGPRSEPVTEEGVEDFRKQLDKSIERASKEIYMRLMEAGRNGLKLEDLEQIMEEEGVSQQVTGSALEKLLKAKKAVELNGSFVTASAARTVNSKLHEIEVERIYPGSAVVRIDGKWRARLEPAEFNGPRNMIKRGSRFLASIDLYRLDGVLRIRVKEVAQKL
ncbi:MAG: helicase-related protein [Conexivisphaerales archaeon]